MSNWHPIQTAGPVGIRPLALLVLVLAGGRLAASEWAVDLPPPPEPPAALAPRFFASQELQASLADWGPISCPLKEPRECFACPLPAACACGGCEICCRCDQRLPGRIGDWLVPWQGTLELGLNGAHGNGDHFNLFLGLDGRYQFAAGAFRLDLDYFYQSCRSSVATNRLVTLGRYEHWIREGPVAGYFEGRYEFDSQRNYDARWAMAGGLSFPFQDREWLTLRSRLGMGTSKKTGAIGDRWRAELQTGLEGELRLSGRQRFFGHVDFYPDLQRLRTYRLNAKLGWEVLLEARWGLALRTSIHNGHDSSPGPGTRANDLYYGMALAWSY